MAEIKTKPTKASTADFIAGIENPTQRKDAKTLVSLMRKVTGKNAVMWGPSIVGFGDYHYTSPQTGREGDWFLTGFSPRKQNTTVYCMTGFTPYPALMAKLGKYKTGGGCLYFKSLDDLHIPTLTKLITQSVKDTKKREAAARKK
jgi:hypothetical protein